MVQSEQKKQTKIKSSASGLFKIILIVLLVLIIVITILQNLNPTPFKFLFLRFESVPLIVIILITLALGYLLGILTFRLVFGPRNIVIMNEVEKMSDRKGGLFAIGQKKEKTKEVNKVNNSIAEGKSSKQ